MCFVGLYCIIHFDVTPSVLRSSKWSLQVSASVACTYFPTCLSVPHALLVCLCHMPYLSVCATCPTYLKLPYVITWIRFSKEDKLQSSSLCNFLKSPVTFFLLGPHIFLSTLFLNTLSLSFSLNVRGQVSHPYKTMGKNYRFVYFSILIPLGSRRYEISSVCRTGCYVSLMSNKQH